jgi:serine/threonine protein kinase
MPVTPGENIGPYRVIEQLGSGGMATVYKAYHPALDRYVAIKIMHPAFKANPQFFERFQREARVVARLEHAHIIPVYDFNEHYGEPYLVMRFIEGDTLKPKMENGPLPPAEILHLIRPVCQALAYAHQQGVLHRDIKPSNIMISQDGNVFLSDFGLARMVQAGESTLSQDMMVGTPQYISPEQAQGLSELDGRTDIYSLGVVLFEMLTGQVPFSADTPFATIHDHIYTPLPLPSTINPDIDPAVERTLLKALAKDPADRFATADELLASLESTLGVQIASPPTADETLASVSPAAKTKIEQPRKKGRPWWVWAGGTALILLVVAGLLIGLLLLRRARRNPPPPPPGQSVPAQAAGVDQPGQPAQPPPGDQPPPPPPADINQGGSDPNSPEHTQAAELVRPASQALQQRHFEDAIDLYNQALQIDPHHLPAYFGLAEALRLSGDEAGSLAVLAEATAQNPQSPVAYRRLGEAQLLAENPGAALPAFEQAVILDPDNPALLAEQAIALLALDRNDEAKQAIDTALRLDQHSPEARLANAIYLLKEREFRPAVLTLQELVQDARAPLFVQNRARRLLEQIKPE